MTVVFPDSLFEQWLPVTETWTRTGDFTFTVTGDLTTRYRKGAKVKYSDGATDYGTVLSSSYSAPNTTVTLFTNTNYAMAAATITDTYISYGPSPEGFPAAFSYTPTWAGGSPSIGNGTLVGEFTVIGNRCKGNIRQVNGNTTTYGSGGTYTWSLPTAAKTFTNGAYANGAGLYDGSVFWIGLANIATGASVLSLVIHSVVNMTSTSPVTFGTNDVVTIAFDFLY